MNRQEHGLLLGKFLPPHLGHRYLADFARHYVDHLTIVVGTLSTEPIDGQLRYRWMRELFPDCNVVHLAKDLPQDPSEHPDFWEIWRRELLEIAPQAPNLLFASEAYGHKLSEVLGARFIPVDPARSIMPVSGTAVRNDPYTNWQYLPPNVRQYYLKRVCVFGPESTGKSTLTEGLADYFKTIAVPEYARTYLEENGTDLDREKLVEIARGQCASEDALSPLANRAIIVDTDPLLTTIWSRFLYEEIPSALVALANSREYDLYLLTDVDVPWVADSVRYLPEDRKNFHQLCHQALVDRGCHFVSLSGSWEKRFQDATSAIEDLFKQ